jgi:hypothetical protein
MGGAYSKNKVEEQRVYVIDRKAIRKEAARKTKA